MTSNCKKSYFMDVGTFKCLSNYLFRKRKYNNILDRDSLNITHTHKVKNENCEVYLKRFILYLTHDFCSFVEKEMTKKSYIFCDINGG